MKIKAIVLSAVVVMALLAGLAYVALGGDDDTRRTGAIGTRTYSAGHYLLELDGAAVGALKSVSGCGVQAKVTQAEGAKEGVKAAGAPTYGPCTFRFASGMGLPLYQWISDALGGKNQSRNLSIVVADSTLKAKSQLDLTDARLTRFTIPTLDAASSEPLFFELTVSPAQIRRQAASGSVGGSSGKTPKAMLVKNFKVSSPELGASVTKVSKVEPWSFDVPLVAEADGEVPGPTQLGDVTLTAADPLNELDTMIEDLRRGRVVQPMTVTVELVDAALTQTLAELSFTGAGLTEAELLSDSTLPKRAFSLFVEGANIKFNSAIQ